MSGYGSHDQWDAELISASKKFISQLFMMLKTAAIYSSNNDAYQSALELLHGDMKRLLDALGAFSVDIVENDLYIAEEKIRSDLTTHTAFAFIRAHLEDRGLSGLRINGDLSRDELATAMSVVAHFTPQSNDLEQAYQELNRVLQAKGIDKLEALEKRDRKLTVDDDQEVVTRKQKALRNYVAALGVVKEAVNDFDSKELLDIRRAKKIVYNLVNHSYDEGYAFVGLSAIKNYDEYTFNHSVNVCVISIAFGQSLGLNKRQLADLGIGALYHDFGKMQVPKEILGKPGQFTDDEFAVMKKHPVYAIKPLLSLRGASDMEVRKVIPAFEHHRNYDLSGYPPVTIRKPLNFYSKVVAIADSFDAMTSDRVYQKGMLPSQALQIILKGARGRFDPVLVKAFINTMGLFPVGSLVQLNNGEYALVSEVHQEVGRSERPKISIVLDAQAKPKATQAIDLSDPQHSGLDIVKAVDPQEFDVNVAAHLFGS